jgi:hypothetical protein
MDTFVCVPIHGRALDGSLRFFLRAISPGQIDKRSQPRKKRNYDGNESASRGLYLEVMFLSTLFSNIFGKLRRPIGLRCSDSGCVGH